MRIRISKVAIAGLLCLPILAQAGGPVCAERKDLSGACFKVSGTLRLYNGAPSARIQIRGTKRLLGVVPYFLGNNETFAAPEGVRNRASFDQGLSGSFSVCPLRKPKPKEMQI